MRIQNQIQREINMKKVISLLLSIIILLSIAAGLDLSAYAAGSSIQTATTITLGRTYNGIITESNNKDVYKFTLSASGRINISVKANIGYSDYYLYNANGNEVRSWTYCYWNENSKQMTLNESIDLTKGMYYFAAVRRYSNTGNYSFSICSHSYRSYGTKATMSKNGSAVTKCTVCGAVKSKSTIYYPKTIKLSKISYTYNGKVQTPSVTVKDSKGKTLGKNTDYTVTYAKGRKNVGKYAVKITFKGKYSGSKTLYYTIKPKSTSISKLTAGKKRFVAKWKKQTSQTTGYQIQYSTNKNFKSAKTVTVSKNKTTSKTISKLKAKKKYYVRIRTYKTVGKTKYYSSWSKVKSVTTKR